MKVIATYALASLCSATLCRAAFVLTATGTFSNPDGPDAGGFENATFVLQTQVPNGVYVDDGFGNPVAQALYASTVITISGTAGGFYDGSFTLSGFTAPEYSPDHSGLYGGFADDYLMKFDLGPGIQELGIAMETIPTASGSLVQIGDTIELEHFSDGPIVYAPESTVLFVRIGTQKAHFDIGNGHFSVQSAPEPSVALLAGVGAMALLRRRRA